MTPLARAALDLSIAHWRRMAEADSFEVLAGEHPGASGCALCREFNHGPVPGATCAGCPVREATGAALCGLTPYQRAGRAFEEWKLAVLVGYEARVIATRRARFRKHAAEEIAFLESLREVTPA